MNINFYIAKKYFFSKKPNSAISIISVISMAGICIGTAALVIVLSVFAGLENFISENRKQVDPQIKISPKMGKTFSLSDNESNKLKDIKSVEFVSKVIQEKVLIRYRNREIISNIKAVDDNFDKIVEVQSTIIRGEFLDAKTRENEIAIPANIAHKLSLGINDPFNSVEIIVPNPEKIQKQNFKKAFDSVDVFPCGIFYFNDDENKNYFLSNIAIAQKLLNLEPNQTSYIYIKLRPNTDEKKAISDIENIVGNKFYVENRKSQQKEFYKMMNTEKFISYLIFSFILLISTFSVSASLIMMILEKKDNLKTLINIGLNLIDIKKIFINLGLMITIIGGFFGIILGIIIILLQQKFGFITIATSGLPINYPVILTFENIFYVLVTTIILGVICSFISSFSITKKLLSNV